MSKTQSLAKTILKGGIDKEKLDRPEKLIDKLKSSFKSGLQFIITFTKPIHPGEFFFMDPDPENPHRS